MVGQYEECGKEKWVSTRRQSCERGRGKRARPEDGEIRPRVLSWQKKRKAGILPGETRLIETHRKSLRLRSRLRVHIHRAHGGC